MNKYEEIADKVLIVLGAISMLLPYIEDLKDALQKFRNQADYYTAIGIIDVKNYEYKCNDMKNRIKRLDSLINFIEVLKDTDYEMTLNKKAKKERDASIKIISQLMGI